MLPYSVTSEAGRGNVDKLMHLVRSADSKDAREAYIRVAAWSHIPSYHHA